MFDLGLGPALPPPLCVDSLMVPHLVRRGGGKTVQITLVNGQKKGPALRHPRFPHGPPLKY